MRVATSDTMAAHHRHTNVRLEVAALLLLSLAMAAGFSTNHALFHNVLPRLIEAPFDFHYQAPGRSQQQQPQPRPAARYAQRA